MQVPRGRTQHALGRGGTVTWPKKHRKSLGPKGVEEIFYKAPKAPKLIYTVILWCRFVVQCPPGGEPSLDDCPPPTPISACRPH